MMTAQKILKLLLMIAVAPIVVALTLFVWICLGLVYVSGLVLWLISMILALLGVAVLITYSPQNGFILLLMAFLISPMGLPLAAIWLLGKVQDLKYAIQDWMYGTNFSVGYRLFQRGQSIVALRAKNNHRGTASLSMCVFICFSDSVRQVVGNQ